MKYPNLYEQYKVHYFDPAWLPYLMNRYRTFNLRTELVIHEPGFFTPQQGRIYETDLWTITDLGLVNTGMPLITTRQGLNAIAAKHPKAGTFDALGHGFGIWDLGEEIFVVEHYEDWGDDGHTQMTLMGYIFVPKSGLELVDSYGRKEFAYFKTLQEKLMQPNPWKCDLCGHGADVCDGHFGDGFQ